MVTGAAKDGRWAVVDVIRSVGCTQPVSVGLVRLMLWVPPAEPVTRVSVSRQCFPRVIAGVIFEGQGAIGVVRHRNDGTHPNGWTGEAYEQEHQVLLRLVEHELCPGPRPIPIGDSDVDERGLIKAYLHTVNGRAGGDTRNIREVLLTRGCIEGKDLLTEAIIRDVVGRRDGSVLHGS